MEDQQGDEQFNDQRSSRNGSPRSLRDDQAADAHRTNHQLEIIEDDQEDSRAGGEDDLYANLKPKQQRAILALVTEPTITQAAKAAEVGERTLRRWLSQPDFSKAYRTSRRESFSQALALALRYTPLAINTLGKLASDTMTPPSSRVSACNGILKFARDSIELDDLQARIEALESAASQKKWRDR